MGPAHCTECIQRFAKGGKRCPTIDVPLMYYLCAGEHMPGMVNPSQRARIERAAYWLWWDGARLRQKVGQGRWLIVPPICDRKRIVAHTAQSLGFPGGKRLFRLLRQTLTWHGMLTECVRVCAEVLPVQLERAKYREAPYLFPTMKTVGPFHTWCLDLVTHLQPPGDRGEQILLVMVDAFTKWIEAVPLITRTS